MSVLRPSLNSDSKLPCVTNGTAYLMILKAVETQPGLVHGLLRIGQNYCAIGSYFEVNRGTSLPQALVDEVAAVNDSVPAYTRAQRKRYMARWLRWRLQQLGMRLPGRRATKPTR